MIWAQVLPQQTAARILDALILHVEEQNGLVGQNIDVEQAVSLASRDMAHAIRMAENSCNPADEIDNQEIKDICNKALTDGFGLTNEALTATEDKKVAAIYNEALEATSDE